MMDGSRMSQRSMYGKASLPPDSSQSNATAVRARVSVRSPKAIASQRLLCNECIESRRPQSKYRKHSKNRPEPGIFNRDKRGLKTHQLTSTKQSVGSQRSGCVKRCGFWHTPFGKLKPKARIPVSYTGTDRKSTRLN